MVSLFDVLLLLVPVVLSASLVFARFWYFLDYGK